MLLNEWFWVFLADALFYNTCDFDLPPLAWFWISGRPTLIRSTSFLIVVQHMQITDVGGSIVVHTFGAYFGLAVSFMLRPSKDEFAANELEGARYNSDLFAMIGEFPTNSIHTSIFTIVIHNDYYRHCVSVDILAVVQRWPRQRRRTISSNHQHLYISCGLYGHSLHNIIIDQLR